MAQVEAREYVNAKFCPIISQAKSDAQK
ncbi:hypothetical protein TELCIR_12839 [Teladorsagia circumcincta]|uniref:Uncharacterized protein n=1 Tax=Teladorsagia circumcincta TaxID=45464 RepID=A0A2G9U5E9_TELCI|nr:hypothetical protein TELCIR_12839 [Teladorsagia circumcincta]